MKNTQILGIFALLVIIATIAACTQPLVDPIPDRTSYDNAIIKYKMYGGFVMQEYAIQELTITPGFTRTDSTMGMPDKPPVAKFIISDWEGNVTKFYMKALTQQEYDEIIKVLKDNDFWSLEDEYIEGQNYVTDVGFADITLAVGNRTKTVKTYNVNDYMPQKVINIREKLQSIIEDLQSQKVELSFRPTQCVKTAWEKWEENSGRVYIRAPTDEEIIKGYYAETYGIDVLDVVKVNLSEAVCEACNVCAVNYKYTLSVEGIYEDAFLTEGWMKSEAEN